MKKLSHSRKKLSPAGIERIERSTSDSYVPARMKEWLRFDKFKMTVKDALIKLNNLVDESDPDTSLPNIVHAFQTAESIRKEHPDLDWFHLTGLIHDLGKVMYLIQEWNRPRKNQLFDTCLNKMLNEYK